MHTRVDGGPKLSESGQNNFFHRSTSKSLPRRFSLFPVNPGRSLSVKLAAIGEKTRVKSKHLGGIHVSVIPASNLPPPLSLSPYTHTHTYNQLFPCMPSHSKENVGVWERINKTSPPLPCNSLFNRQHQPTNNNNNCPESVWHKLGRKALPRRPVAASQNLWRNKHGKLVPFA